MSDKTDKGNRKFVPIDSEQWEKIVALAESYGSLNISAAAIVRTVMDRFLSYNKEDQNEVLMNE